MPISVLRGSDRWSNLSFRVEEQPTPSHTRCKEVGCSVYVTLCYQRTPTLTGITFVPAATLVVPNPFGCVVTAGVRTST